LECGVLAHGFERARCESCKDELLHSGLREHLSRTAAERLQRTARLIGRETPGGQDDVCI
jgi:hypothetical protein